MNRVWVWQTRKQVVHVHEVSLLSYFRSTVPIDSQHGLVN
jgi:hypothetical protein